MNFDRFFANKRIVILATVLMGVILMLFLARLLTRPEQSQVTISPSPAQSFLPQMTASASAAIISTQPIPYKPGEMQTDLQRISDKKPLSAGDTQIKQKLITSLRGQSGVIRATTDFQAEYIKSADSFMVEIRNVESGKTSAEKYFRDSGLSQEGLCNLPVVFYLSSKAQTELVNNGKTFNPIPTGC